MRGKEESEKENRKRRDKGKKNLKKKKKASIDAGLSRGEAMVDRQAKQQRVTCSAEFASLCGPTGPHNRVDTVDRQSKG